MEKLSDLIGNLESNIPKHESENGRVSKGSVGWHIEHSLLVFNAVTNALSQSNPADYKRTFSINRSCVMITGKIPRGKVKAPAAVQPAIKFDKGSLQQHIRVSEENIKRLEKLPHGQFFRHPFLGDFKLNAALRFLKIHTKHHLYIINDIIKCKPIGS